MDVGNLNPFTKSNLRALFTVHPRATSGPVTPRQAKEIGMQLFVDWKKVNPATLAHGINIELEHKATLASIGVRDSDMLKAAARIALDHLAEDSQYYVKLKKVEGN